MTKRTQQRGKFLKIKLNYFARHYGSLPFLEVSSMTDFTVDRRSSIIVPPIVANLGNLGHPSVRSFLDRLCNEVAPATHSCNRPR